MKKYYEWTRRVYYRYFFKEASLKAVKPSFSCRGSSSSFAVLLNEHHETMPGLNLGDTGRPRCCGGARRVLLLWARQHARC